MLPVLILAHLLADFVLQNRWLVVRKQTVSGLALHTALVGAAMLLVAWRHAAQWWPWLLLVMGTHGAIDWTKVWLQGRLRWAPIVLFLADQAAHLLVICGVAALAAAQGQAWWDPNPLWAIASIYVLATWAVSVALPLWLDPDGFMERPLSPRLITIASAAVALTLAWRGLALLVPLVGLGVYHVLARRVACVPPTTTFGVEYWAAILVAASLGWTLG